MPNNNSEMHYRCPNRETRCQPYEGWCTCDAYTDLHNLRGFQFGRHVVRLSEREGGDGEHSKQGFLSSLPKSCDQLHWSIKMQDPVWQFVPMILWTGVFWVKLFITARWVEVVALCSFYSVEGTDGALWMSLPEVVPQIEGGIRVRRRAKIFRWRNTTRYGPAFLRRFWEKWHRFHKNVLRVQ